MKTTQIKVKTIYDIEIEYSDFSAIFVKAKKDITRLGAFEEFNLDDTTIGNIQKCFKALDAHCFSERCKQACEDLQYVVRALGFDGIENYGYYDKDKNRYKLVVYNNGADI